MPSESDRQEAQASRAEALRNEQQDTAESVQGDAEFPYAPAIEQPQAQPQVEVNATFVPEGIIVSILIPHEGITVDLPDLPNTLSEHGGTEA